MSNQKIVYITGCLGFIGSYVTRACLDQGWYVKGIDKITYAARKELLEEFNNNPKFSFEKLDICNIERLVDCDYFINTAAETHVDNSIRKSIQKRRIYYTNIYSL
jgi:dTDP-glucose 4,6-dehydratase